MVPTELGPKFYNEVLPLDSSILSRTMNPYTQEMRDFMNMPDKIIVVYDENEETAYKVATEIFLYQ